MADADAAHDNGKTYTVKDSHGKVTQKLKLECGWSQTTQKAGKCVPIVTNGPKLYQGKAQCDALATRLGVRISSPFPFPLTTPSSLSLPPSLLSATEVRYGS